MEQSPAYSKHVDFIEKEAFIHLFSTIENSERWFSGKELEAFSFPGNARSLAGRYLIKKRICDHISEPGCMNEIEIMNDSFGKPEIYFGKDIRNAIDRAGIRKILCSISHSRNYITGMTIFCM
jgi:phosphopantetheinyl transferase (holo-ACP synthase)